MKKIALMTLLFFSLTTYAQSEYNWSWDWDFDKTSYQPIKYEAPKGFNSVVFTSVSHKGKIKMYKKTYDNNGNLLGFYEKDKQNEFVPVVEYLYDDKDLIKTSKSYKKGRLKNTVVKSRLPEGKPLETKKTNSKNELISRSTWEYNANNCVVSSKRFKKGDKLSLAWEYEYHGDCEKSKTTLKKGSGKVMQVWTYDCKEEGEILQKKKNEVQICKWDETNKDYLIKVSETFNEKGEVIKTVRKYTITDTLIVETSMYDLEGELIRHSTYDNDYARPLVVERFKKGKPWFSNKYVYENKNLVSHSYLRKGKVRTKFIYVYDENRLVERKAFNDKEEMRSTVSLSYTKSSS